MTTAAGTDRVVERRATYRVQLTPDFGFADAEALLPYLADLGISHLYLSPVLQAQTGSTHGYDVTDHLQVSQDLGGEVAFASLCASTRAAGLALLIDIVPNHMAVATPANRWWMDVLANGRASRYAGHFDIDWDPPETKLAGRVLVPVLGDHYGRVLEAGELRLVREGRGPEPGHAGTTVLVAYYDHRFPIDPRSLAPIVERVATAVGSSGLDFLARALHRLPPSATDDPRELDERRADTPVLLRALADALGDPKAAAALDDELARINGDVDALDELLSAQQYRLASWRVSGRELDYRRFFDVDDLVGLRTEELEVFDEVHERILGWVADGWVDGIRIDHVDGLRDPARYLQRLRERAPASWIVVEKILEPGEDLRSSWPIAGTTGYEIADLIGGLFVDPAAEAPLTALFAELTGDDATFDEVLLRAKHDVMRDVLGAEVNRLTESFVRVGEGLRRFRDFSRHELHETVREVLAAMPVYRTYVTDDGDAAPEDVEVLERATEHARAGRPDLDPELFTLLRGILAADGQTGPTERELRARFQQSSGAVMAKSKEDTAFYRYTRYVGANEVGGDPNRFGVSIAEFHEAAARRQADWPQALATLTTHDTKRSEDVRARLAVLTEIPDRWSATVRSWFERNARHRGPLGPDPATELLIYQTLVGAHPLPLDRARTYLRKAMREAKVHTSWVDPAEEYEAQVDAFVEGLLEDAAFTAELDAFVAPLVVPGRINALAQKLVELCLPGVPDLYQGQELWDLSLVDPDNRRPVDYGRRAAVLEHVQDPHAAARAATDLAAGDDVGAAKLLVVHRALALRAERPAAFGPDSDYDPVVATGPDGDDVLAFARGTEVVVAVPRRSVHRDGRPLDAAIALPDGTWRDALGVADAFAGTVTASDLFDAFPVALLARDR